MSSENSIEVNLSQDVSQTDLSGLNSGAVLSGQPPCATLDAYQVANLTLGQLQFEKKTLLFVG